MAKSTPKILFVATVFTHLAAFHKPFMLMLKDKGFEIHAAASSAEGRMEEIQALGIRCWDIPFARTPYSIANIKAVKALKQLFLNHKFKLIHFHTPVAAFLGRYAAYKEGQGSKLYTAHGFHFFKGAPLRNWLVYYSCERLASKWTEALIVMNDEDFEVGKKFGFKPGKNLFNVHGVGVDLSIFSIGEPSKEFKVSMGFDENSLLVTCVAELIPRKNHKYLLKTWVRVADKINNAQLVLVGDGALITELKRFVAERDIPSVRFLGYRQDVPDIIRNSDIVTLVSRHEGLPRCIMEAMACGKPVVISDVRGSRDLVLDGKTGFKIPLGDIEGLAEALTTLLSNEQLRLEMGNNARKFIEDYSLDCVLKEMEHIYDYFL